MRRLAILIGAMALAACGTTPRRPLPPVAPAAVPAAEAKALLNDYRLDLKAVAADAVGGALDPSLSDGELWVELPAAALFEQGNAQLRVAALKPLGEIASSIAGRGACVAHIVAYAADDATADLAERRAASVLEDFSRQPISLGRLRAASRIDPSRADRVYIGLRPVVIGRENAAWVPPSLGE